MKFHLWSVFFLVVLLAGCQEVDYEAMKTEIKQELEEELIATLEAHYQTIETYQLEDFNNHIREVSEKIQSCTVAIEVTFSSGNPTIGSGLMYKQEDNHYYVLTNEHVIRHHHEIYIYLFENDQRIEVSIEKLDAEKDLAMLSFELDEVLSYCAIQTTDYQVGDIVFAVGSMVSLDYRNSITIGMISALSETRIQHDAAINVGSSGGPLFNLYGELIGINVSKISTTSVTGSITPVVGVGFAIPLEVIIAFIS